MAEHSCRLCCWLLSLLCLAAPETDAWAQGSLADYERADSLRQRFQGKVVAERIDVHWLEEGSRLWMRTPTGLDTHRFLLVDTADGLRRDLFNHDRLAAALSEATGDEQPADRLPLSQLALEGDDRLTFRAGRKSWACDLESYKLEEAPAASASSGTTVETLRRIRPSEHTGGDTSILFVNQTDAPVSLFWIGDSGQRRRYEAIQPGQEHEQHTYAGHVWLAMGKGEKPVGVYRATAAPGVAVIDGSWKPSRRPNSGRPRQRQAVSPDGRWRASIVDHNVVVRDSESDEEKRLTSDGSPEDRYLPRFFWSPDSSRLVVMREQPVEERTVHVVESTPKDQLQPKLHDFSYVKPGDPLPKQRPTLFDVSAGKAIELDSKLFDNPWSLGDFHWDADSTRFTFLYNQRGHQVLRLMAIDAVTGEAQAVIDEKSDTFLCYSSKTFLHRLDKSHEAVWMSERDGWNHLYLYDTQQAKVVNQITHGEWVVRGVDRVDEEKRQVWFQAGGVRAGQDPYYVHYCRVNFDGTGMTILTEGDGTHDIEHSPNGRHFIDRYSRVDMPPVTELRRTSDGALVCTLAQADWSPLATVGWTPPIHFVAKGRDGQTDIYGAIFRPSHFDPKQRYPVVENIYAGPHSAHVPKRFATQHRGQELAELGFVVVRIDGMGTSHRSKAFHDVCWQNLADSGFPDRIAWIKAAAEEYPWIDASRVGIYGGSAGGQNAMRAVLDHGDFYHAAVADCGCHDNRMDKIWWNEQWMGWPIGPHYEASSNAAHASRLTGKLMLTVGELDRNVDPASTMQVVDALIKADKDFDLIVFPGQGHGAGGGKYGTRRMRDFFVRHLMGVEPRWE